MDTRFIKTLLAVVDAGSFASAARSENLTAAAVSQRVRSLEIGLNEPLVVRSGQCVVPTPACLSMLPRMRQILEEVGNLSSELDSTGLSGEIRIGSISTALSDRVPDILKRFAKDAPRASLRIFPGTSNDLFTKLIDSEIDAAFLIRPPFSIPKNLEAVSVESQSFVIIVQARDERSVEEIIATERALIYDVSSWGGNLVRPWLRKNVLPKDTLCELDALEAIASAISQGLGFAVVPDWQGLSYLDTIRRIPLPEIAARRELVLLHRRLTPAAVKLLAGSPDQVTD